jgi:hypothetical protein
MTQRKTKNERNRAEREAEQKSLRERAIREGNVYRIVVAVAGTTRDPVWGNFAPTFAEACELRDEMHLHRDGKLPDDLLNRRGTVQYLRTHIEHYENGQWSELLGEHRQGPFNVLYPE